MDRNHSIIWLAGKYLKGRSQRGISRGHYLTLIGIALGVVALIAVSSVMNGFRADIKSRIIGTLAEMRLSSANAQPLEAYQDLIASLAAQGYKAAPVVRAELLLKRDTAAVPALCFGIDPQLHPDVAPVLKQAREQGSFEGLLAGDLQNFEDQGIVLGAGLASALNVYIGDELQLISPLFNIPTAFGLLPRVKILRVVAIFSAGMPEYDQNYAYIPLAVAQEFNAYADVADYLEIRSPNSDQSAKSLQKLRPLYPEYRLEDWSSFDASLYGAIRFEKYLMFVIMLFMFIIASFNLTGSLLKLITQKKRELGLLKAMGYTEKDLSRLFLYQGLILSSIGIMGGLVLGTVLLVIQDQFGIVKLSMGSGDAITLPVQMMLADYLLVIIVSYGLTILSVMLPLRRLKDINAVELIRRNV